MCSNQTNLPAHKQMLKLIANSSTNHLHFPEANVYTVINTTTNNLARGEAGYAFQGPFSFFFKYEMLLEQPFLTLLPVVL